MSFLSYNEDKCEWKTYVDSFKDLQKQIADATDPANQANIDICPDSPIVFEDIIDISDKYFKAECLGSGCVFDLNGYSFVTNDQDGADFNVDFQGISFENGSSVSTLSQSTCTSTTILKYQTLFPSKEVTLFLFTIMSLKHKCAG